MNSLPDAFIQRMRLQLGNELQDFMRAMEELPVRGIRLNPEKPSDGTRKYLEYEPVPWAEYGYYLPENSSAGSTVYHEAGAFYIQDPSAMLPAEVMNPLPGEKILDLCSAPGGKATQMALKMRGEGIIVCNEPIPKRAQILSRNIERMGVINSIVTECYPKMLPGSWNGFFDGVLVDAPCSGEGMFRKEPDTCMEWTAEKASGCAERQLDILRDASRMIRPGGRLVYSTCTYNPEENERLISRFTELFPEFFPEEFSLPGAFGKNGMLTCYPHRMKGEGQFVAKLRKSGRLVPTNTEIYSFGTDPCEVLKAYRLEFPMLPVPNAYFGSTLALLPEHFPDLKNIRVRRAGLHLAEIKGKHLVPDHAAALGNLKNDAQKKELTPEEVQSYISGLSVSGTEKGWILLTYNGLSLGWGKGTDGMIRNHYPKGLRKNRIITDAQ